MASKRNTPTCGFTQNLDSMTAAVSEDADVVRLGDVLRALAAVDPNLAKVVDCRFFVGLDEKETAEILGVSDRTIRRWWTQARAWIHVEMSA